MKLNSKRITHGFLAVGLFLTGVVFAGAMPVQAEEAPARVFVGGDLYPKTYIVVEVDEVRDVVTVESVMGHRYAFYGIDDWAPGDLCSCIMSNAGTPEVYDDVIVATAYSGIAEWFAEICPNPDCSSVYEIRN